MVNFVYYMGKPAQVRAEVMEQLKKGIDTCSDLEVMDLQQMEVGDRVKIKQGLMSNKEGQVIRLGEKEVVVVIDHLNCVLLSKVSRTALELIN